MRCAMLGLALLLSCALGQVSAATASDPRIFVTSSAYNVNLGGIAGADAICTAEAGTDAKALLVDESGRFRDAAFDAVCATFETTDLEEQRAHAARLGSRHSRAHPQPCGIGEWITACAHGIGSHCVWGSALSRRRGSGRMNRQSAMTYIWIWFAVIIRRCGEAIRMRLA